jgi:hypothetical protein
MRNLLRISLLTLSILMLVVPAIAETGLSSNTDVTPQAPSITVIDRDADCTLIDFEGIGNNLPVGVYAGPVTVTFGTSWLGLVDADDGGDGNFANEPSSNTIAYFLDTSDMGISLSPSVQYLEFWYTASASSLPVTVTAYDSAGNVVDSATGNTVGTSTDGADCAGDPTGVFCLFDVISLTADANNIAYIEILGATSNQFGFDNFFFCTDVPETGACCFDDDTCQEISAENCASAGGIYLTGEHCDTVDCGSVPVDGRDWSTVKKLY